jgi:hypothetical protein
MSSHTRGRKRITNTSFPAFDHLQEAIQVMNLNKSPDFYAAISGPDNDACAHALLPSRSNTTRAFHHRRASLRETVAKDPNLLTTLPESSTTIITPI